MYKILTAVLGEYVRAYNARVFEVPRLLAGLSHGGSGGDHSVLGLLGAHGAARSLYHAPFAVPAPGCEGARE